MSREPGYRVVVSDTKGKIVIATRDFLLGATVMEEKEPVLLLSDELLQRFKMFEPADMQLFLAVFDMFQREMTAEMKSKLLTLYGPTTGGSAENVREFASRLNMNNQPMTAEEVETFVRLASIARFNMFGGTNDSRLVFAETTRLAHSCSPNCSYHIYNNKIAIRSHRSIAAGEELTISYMPERDTEPIQARRYKFLEAKEFTCHCERCDAPGDDTRQFDCFNPACKGVMMVYQPVGNAPIRLPGANYTGAGVEYIQPHLLPCTVCHRAAPIEYQTKMLALEATLPELVKSLVAKQISMVKQTYMGADRDLRLLKEIEDLKLPLRHQMVVPVLNVILKIHRFRFMDVAMDVHRGDVDKCRAAVQRAAYEYIAAQERITPGVKLKLERVLFYACHDTIIEWQDPRLMCPYIFTPQQAKPLLQRLLRMKLILRHPDAPREEKIDTALVKVLSEQPPAELSTELCAFCEESPLRAAVTLSRCGRCKKVVYCSAGCQKAHWKLHKKTCKVEKM